MSLTSPVYNDQRYHRRGAQVGKKLGRRKRRKVKLTPQELEHSRYRTAKHDWTTAEIANRLIDLELHERA